MPVWPVDSVEMSIQAFIPSANVPLASKSQPSLSRCNFYDANAAKRNNPYPSAYSQAIPCAWAPCISGKVQAGNVAPQVNLLPFREPKKIQQTRTRSLFN